MKLKKPKAPQIILEDRLTPPNYQVELICTALKRNTLLCVSNDMGLQYTPVILIKHLSSEVIGTLEAGACRTLYLQPDKSATDLSVCYETLLLHLSLRIGIVHSDFAADKVKAIWKENHVICMTASKCLFSLESKLIDFGEVNLIVLDQCDEGLLTGSIYAKIVSLLRLSPHFNRVRLFGLTSSIITQLDENPALLGDKISSLEKRLACKAETTTDLCSIDAPAVTAEEIVEVYPDHPVTTENGLTGCEGISDHVVDKEGQTFGDCSDDLSDDYINNIAELENDIRRIISNTYHFIGDLIISQADIDAAKREKPKKKPASVSDHTDNSVLEPSVSSEAWLQLQSIKEIPRKVLREVEGVLNELGLWCAGCVAENLSCTIEKILDRSTDRLESQLLILTRTQLNVIHTLVNRASEAIWSHTQLLHMSTPKVQKLIDILKSYLPKIDFEIAAAVSSSYLRDFTDDGFSDFSDLSDGDQEKEQEPVTIAKVKRSPTADTDNVVKVNQAETTLSGLVFVRRCHHAFALHKYIEQLCIWDNDMYFIRSTYLTSSQSIAEGDEADGMITKRQEARLVQFRQHKVNLTVGTFILQSDMDIPKCNLVVMFDPPLTYQSYIKSKRRACALHARYYTMCPQSQSEQFGSHMKNFASVEKILINRCERSKPEPSPLAEDIEIASETVPPFVAHKTKATVTLENAIGLLNRYCAKLPSDIFTRLTPTGHTVTVEGGFQTTIKLPVNCRLKNTVQGKPMKTEKLAVAAAALKTCQVLYENGELDDQLMPIGKEYLRNEQQDQVWEKENKAKPCRGQPGSAKRKQNYTKQIAAAFADVIQPDVECHLYMCQLELTVAVDPHVVNKGRSLFITHDYPYSVALVLKHKIPPVAEFPLFTRSGQESVHIVYCRPVILSPAQYDLITQYHSFVFQDVLRLDKFPLKLDPTKSEFNVLVAPIRSDSRESIDWDYLNSTLEKYRTWSNRPPLFSREPTEFIFNKHAFQDAVVMPAYRNQDQPEYFFVADVRYDLNPDSPFPSPDLYESFYLYYTSKYGIEVTNKTQPLLDVDRTSCRLHLLTPRFMNQKGVRLHCGTRDKKCDGEKPSTVRERQILIPELCDIHPCSAGLWRKLVCVPSILTRMNSLLLSSQLATRINAGLDLGWSLESSTADDKLDLGIDISTLATLLQENPESSVYDVGVPPQPTSNSSTTEINSEALNDQLARELDGALLLEDGVASTESAVSDHDTEDDSAIYEPVEYDTFSDYDDEDLHLENVFSDLGLDREEMTQQQSGPSVTQILHALTMSNANDLINLERLETVGDSFLKFAVTLYLFCTHPGLHEGRLSYGRSKQVSNFNLYYLGKKLGLHEYLISDKFEPAENWLPPGYVLSQDFQPIGEFRIGIDGEPVSAPPPGPPASLLIPYNLRTQHSIPDKAIADCVESLIGCYLTSCGPNVARVFMAWLGINVLPTRSDSSSTFDPPPDAAQTEAQGQPTTRSNRDHYSCYSLPRPQSPLFYHVPDAHSKLNSLLVGLESFQERIGYSFNDKAYLVQAFTHSSYVHNQVTDCYQRLEFLGDAVLDYVITRHQYEDHRKHSPGMLTDLRSALVNNNIFAALAVKWDFHKYILYISTQMYDSVHKFVQHQKSRRHRIQVDQYMRVNEEGCSNNEEVEIPKVLGDIFESVAGAIYLDSGLSLDALWKVYYPLMKSQLVQFSKNIPKSPVRELLEMEPETAKFLKPERTKDGKIRVNVTVAGKGLWYGIGRSYKMAKSAAAKQALIALKSNS